MCVATACSLAAAAQVSFDYRGEIWLNASSGELAPYGIMSNRYGVVTQSTSAMMRVAAVHSWEPDTRLSWTAGADLLVRAASSTDYSRYIVDSDAWIDRSLRPASVGIHQLFAGLRYRSLSVIAGMKEYPSALLNDRLSSGDFTRSVNARPMPGVALGFWRFVDVPLTNGALQVEGQVFYGRSTDDDWVEDHFNYYATNLTTNWWYNYKRLYFRTKPSLPLSVTFGMQAACQNGYHYRYYAGGHCFVDHTDNVNLWEAIKMLVPETGEGYWRGNHLGSWDLMARYRLSSGHQLKAYFEWPWEDGSGIGRRNGWDGIWGLEYVAANPRALIAGAVVEYIDFTNQSGPIHWAPADRQGAVMLDEASADIQGTTITDEATGADSYYNNANYNGYAYYGMGLGTPFLPATIYNRDGYLRYVDTRVRGFHVAAMGWVGPRVDYRVMLSYRQGWGDYYVPRPHKVHDLSWTLEAGWQVPSVPSLKVTAIASMDCGNMIGDNFGAALSITYSGSFNLGCHGK